MPILPVRTNILSLYLLFVLLFITSRFFAQQPNYKIYGIDDGLPSSEFYDLIEDKNGYIWFTSDKGVVRYDYHSFENFTTEDSLSNTVNFTFYQETDSTFWLNGIDGSFTFWNGKRFVPFVHNNILRNWRAEENNWNEILHIDENYLYFTSSRMEKKLFKVKKKTGEIFEDQFSTIKNFPKLNNKHSRYISLIKYYRKKPENYKTYIDRYTYLTTIPKEITPEGNFRIIFNEYLSDKGIHLLTDQGIMIYDKEGKKIIEKIQIKNSSISSSITSINGELWCTSTTYGIIRISNPAIKILNFPSDDTQSINGIFATDNYLYIKSILGETFILDKNNNLKSAGFLGEKGISNGIASLENKEDIWFGSVNYLNGTIKHNSFFRIPSKGEGFAS